MPYTAPVDVLVLLIRDETVLLALRSGTGYADGQWNAPSGKLEDGEDALTAIVREAREEIGLELAPGQLRFVATVHHRSPEAQGRLGLFFTTDTWVGEPVNAEPHKCAGLSWFPLRELPANTVPYTAAGIHCYLTDQRFLTHGW